MVMHTSGYLTSERFGLLLTRKHPTDSSLLDNMKHVSAKPSALAEGITLLQKIKLCVINNTH